MINLKPTKFLFAFISAVFVTLISYLYSFLALNPLLSTALLFGAVMVVSLLMFVFLIEKPTANQHQELQQRLGLSDGNTLLELFERQQQKISKTGKQINIRASELAINSAEVSFFLAELAKAINLSGDDVDRLATAAEQMSSNTNQINENAAIASEQANSAMQATNAGVQLLSDNVNIIQGLNTDVGLAAEKITQLSEKASEIQNITDVIDAISGQTNLLALNAAIEAARAGEQGRGFAVVADEVRALAAKTADATEQIASMLKQMSEETCETTQVMDKVVEQSQAVVGHMEELSTNLTATNDLMAEASGASDQISFALQEQNATTNEITEAITNLHEFLLSKGQDTEQISQRGEELSTCTEAIFVELSEFDTDSLTDNMAKEAVRAAQQVGKLFSDKVKQGVIAEQALFDFQYQAIANTNPPKYSTSFDQFTDKVLPSIQEPVLSRFDEVIYAGAVDKNGYFPTHNTCFSKPLTGDYDIDMVNNRTKRIFDDATGIRCGQHTKPFLLQTYKRDTGEIMHDVSAPIFVNGKHWGGFRMGFKAA